MHFLQIFRCQRKRGSAVSFGTCKKNVFTLTVSAQHILKMSFNRFADICCTDIREVRYIGKHYILFDDVIQIIAVRNGHTLLIFNAPVVTVCQAADDADASDGSLQFWEVDVGIAVYEFGTSFTEVVVSAEVSVVLGKSAAADTGNIDTGTGVAVGRVRGNNNFFI